MGATGTITKGVTRSLGAVERINGYVERHGVRRGLELALRARPGRADHMEMTWPGYAAPFRLRMDGGSDIATFDEVIVDRCYDLPFELAPTTIIDAGANIGLTAAYFAVTYPDATIVTIEPDPSNFELLQHNVAPYANVHPVRAAVWTSSGTVRLGDPRNGPRGFRVDDAAPRGFDVDAVTLVEIMDRFGMDTVDLLKIDVEGAEVELFADPSAWIDRVGAIAIELHDRARPGCSRALFGATGDFEDEWLRGETTFLRRTRPASAS